MIDRWIEYGYIRNCAVTLYTNHRIMLYSCPNGGTLNIDSNFFTWLTDAELCHRCNNRSIRDVGNPFADSYLEIGDRDADDIDEDEELDDEDYDSDHIRGINWEDTGLDPEGYED